MGRYQCRVKSGDGEMQKKAWLNLPVGFPRRVPTSEFSAALGKLWLGRITMLYGIGIIESGWFQYHVAV